MSSFDELDREIDQEMGWSRGKKPGVKGASDRRRPDYWHAILNTARVTSPLWRGLKGILRPIFKVIFFPIVSPMGYAKRFNVEGDMVVMKRSVIWRVFDGILTRLLLTPVIVGLFLIAVVYASTHPKALRASNTPDGFGLFYKRVSLFTVDNQRIAAWYVPPIDANSVSFDPDGALSQKYPAVVLCHGLGATQDQYLPLAKDLHNAGFGVLMLDMRGEGESDPAAVTYGLRERLDVLAGVKFLRESPYIDAGKVCAVGHDIGAMAVLQAAALDTSITAVVADGMWPRFEDRARNIFARPGMTGAGTPAAGTDSAGPMPTQWLAPLYSVVFEIAVRDRLNQLDPEVVMRNIHTQPVMFVARDGGEYAPVQDVTNLASKSPGPHEVITTTEEATVRAGGWENRICGFLMQSTGWAGPRAHGNAQIESLMKNKVPEKK